MIGKLLYADDIILLSESPNKLQQLWRCVLKWCIERNVYNANKSKIGYFRKVRTEKTDKVLKIDHKNDLVQQYKYLGLLLDEHLKFEPSDNVPAKSGGRDLTALINKMLIKILIMTFPRTYYLILAFPRFCYLVVKRVAIINLINVIKYNIDTGLQDDTEWGSPTIDRHVSLVRFWNRLMKPDRLTERFFVR